MKFVIRLDNYKLFLYMYYMFNMVSFFVYIENILILVSVLFVIYVFIIFCKKRMIEKWLKIYKSKWFVKNRKLFINFK